jgi:hypothetical protein
MVDLLKKHFVAFALSNAGWNMNMTPAEAGWLKDRGARACTQGMSVFTAGGQVLGTGGGYQAAPNIKMLKDALRKYKPEAAVEVADAGAAVAVQEVPAGWLPFLPRLVPGPAKGGVVLFVTWKALGLPEQPTVLPKDYSLADYKLCRKMLTVDRVWAAKAEADALAAGAFPAKLKQRIAAHVGFVMSSKVKSLDLTLRGQRLSGSFLLENGEHCTALGFVAAKEGKVRRFELIVKGRSTGKASDHGLTSLGLVPEGKRHTAVVAFMLADPNDELAKVQPGSGRDIGGGEEQSLAKGGKTR